MKRKDILLILIYAFCIMAGICGDNGYNGTTSSMIICAIITFGYWITGMI